MLTVGLSPALAAAPPEASAPPVASSEVKPEKPKEEAAQTTADKPSTGATN